MTHNRHTFLFIEAVWSAEGVYVDESENPFPLVGQTEIVHGATVWINTGSMRINGPQPSELRNRYEIAPFQPGVSCTAWRSFNPDLGPLVGQFVVVADTILSAWRTEDGRASGAESLLQINESEYQNRGVAFFGPRRMSSWAATLKRIHAPV